MINLKTINLAELEERFGSEFAEDVKSKMEFCKEEGLEWKLEVVDTVADTWVEIAFTTKHWARMWDVNAARKKVDSKFSIGHNQIEEVLKIMKSF